MYYAVCQKAKDETQGTTTCEDFSGIEMSPNVAYMTKDRALPTMDNDYDDMWKQHACGASLWNCVLLICAIYYRVLLKVCIASHIFPLWTEADYITVVVLTTTISYRA